MKKIIIGISTSVVYTIVGLLILLSIMIEKFDLYGKSYKYEFGFFNQVADGVKIIGYDIAMFTVGLPALIMSLSAGILACTSLCIYRKNHAETPKCRVLSITSLCIVWLITSIYIIGTIGIFVLFLIK